MGGAVRELRHWDEEWVLNAAKLKIKKQKPGEEEKK